MFVYAQFPGNWAEVYEFSSEAFSRIASGNIDPLYDAGIANFTRITVESDRGYYEVWNERNSRNSRNNFRSN